ncbi:MAG: molybdopterin biosynthesis protein MoeY [Pseudomonadota bacterium]|nr:molybdopterin biosynthesis protein MoeY [Pseudomonadota bacterium]
MKSLPSHLEHILDLARWAPSGDNTQPWAFEILGDEQVLIHGFDTRDHVVYDLDGHPSQLAVGALLETLAIAATSTGRITEIQRRPGTPDTHLLFDVHLRVLADLASDPLVPHIKTRVVQRRAMSTTALTAQQKSALADALPAGYRVVWFEGAGERWRLAKFMFDNAKIRLTIPEAYAVHRAVIEWGARYSEDRIPDAAVGVDALTSRFMRWVMQRWERVAFFNKYLFGHIPPRLQLDLVPGFLCAAHFMLCADKPLVQVDDHIAAGRAMQRFWLTADRLGLFIQPEMTPVIFSRYARRGITFTQTEPALRLARDLNRRLLRMPGLSDADALFFMGRIGHGPAPRARSLRKPLGGLLIHN